MDLCHVFVFAEPDATLPGLTPSFQRTHPGQGTANRCYCFDDAYVELLWVTDCTEITSERTAPTGLSERARWRELGTCPIGIALRSAEPLPFSTWDYRPSFLPESMSIEVAEISRDPMMPFVFRSPGAARPDAWTDGRAGTRQTEAGLSELDRIVLTAPQALDTLRTHLPDRIEVREGSVWSLTLSSGPWSQTLP